MGPKWAIIVAGGTGKRMGAEVPKQFLMLHGKPVLHWSIERFHATGAQVCVVVHPEWLEAWKEMAIQAQSPTHLLVAGGKERYHSVQHAIHAIPDSTGMVAIHDAARPHVSSLFLHRMWDEAHRHGSAIPVMPVVESLRQQGEHGPVPVDRKQFLSIQTPQCFRLSEIREAYKQQYDASFTDDATVVERFFPRPLHFTPGERFNIKITQYEDWEAIKLLFKPIENHE